MALARGTILRRRRKKPDGRINMSFKLCPPTINEMPTRYSRRNSRLAGCHIFLSSSSPQTGRKFYGFYFRVSRVVEIEEKLLPSEKMFRKRKNKGGKIHGERNGNIKRREKQGKKEGETTFQVETRDRLKYMKGRGNVNKNLSWFFPFFCFLISLTLTNTNCDRDW